MVSQEHGSVAKIRTGMERYRTRYATRSQFQIPLIQRKLGPIRNWTIWYQRTEKVARCIRHSRNVDSDGLHLHAAYSGRLPQVQNRVESERQVFF
jgi:hypothetical protein